MNRVDFERDFWDDKAKDPDVEKKYMSNTDTDLCLGVIIPHLKRGKILELGCGIGRLINKINLKYCQFYGVDISNKLLGIAAEAGKSNLILCDGRTIPLEDKSMDSVYSMLLFQHLPPKAVKGYINEVSRVLVKGGVFRFQFIEGTEADLMSWHYSRDIVLDWLRDANFIITNIEKGLLHPLWTWITVMKYD